VSERRVLQTLQERLADRVAGEEARVQSRIVDETFAAGLARQKVKSMARIDNAAASGERQGGPSDPIRVTSRRGAARWTVARFAACIATRVGTMQKGMYCVDLSTASCTPEPGRAWHPPKAKDTGAKLDSESHRSDATVDGVASRRHVGAAASLRAGSLSIIDSARVVAAQQAIASDGGGNRKRRHCHRSAPPCSGQTASLRRSRPSLDSLPLRLPTGACRFAPPRSSKAARVVDRTTRGVRRTRRRRNRASATPSDTHVFLEHTNEGAVVWLRDHAATWPHWRP